MRTSWSVGVLFGLVTLGACWDSGMAPPPATPSWQVCLYDIAYQARNEVDSVILVAGSVEGRLCATFTGDTTVTGWWTRIRIADTGAKGVSAVFVGTDEGQPYSERSYFWQPGARARADAHRAGDSLTFTRWESHVEWITALSWTLSAGEVHGSYVVREPGFELDLYTHWGQPQ